MHNPLHSPTCHYSGNPVRLNELYPSDSLDSRKSFVFLLFFFRGSRDGSLMAGLKSTVILSDLRFESSKRAFVIPQVRLVKSRHLSVFRGWLIYARFVTSLLADVSSSAQISKNLLRTCTTKHLSELLQENVGTLLGNVIKSYHQPKQP